MVMLSMGAFTKSHFGQREKNEQKDQRENLLSYLKGTINGSDRICNFVNQGIID